MRKLIFIGLMCCTWNVFADGPKHVFKDPVMNDELDNAYKDIGNVLTGHFTQWVSYTPVIAGTNWSANINSGPFGRWRRVGDTMEVEAGVGFSAEGVGLFTISIPSGYVIDTAKNARGDSGDVLGVAFQNGTAAFSGGVLYATTTSVYLFGPQTATVWGAGIPGSWVGAYMTARFSVPIVGWGF